MFTSPAPRLPGQPSPRSPSPPARSRSGCPNSLLRPLSPQKDSPKGKTEAEADASCCQATNGGVVGKARGESAGHPTTRRKQPKVITVASLNTFFFFLDRALSLCADVLASSPKAWPLLLRSRIGLFGALPKACAAAVKFSRNAPPH